MTLGNRGSWRLKGLCVSPHGASSAQRWWPIIAIAIVLVGVRWGTFGAPPTWDAAMSVWPAAIEISTRNSVTQVLDLPTYIDGGPNTHTLSLITLLTALTIESVGPQIARVILHVFNVVLLLGVGLMVAGAVSAFSSKRLGWLSAAAVVFLPMMVGQSAYLYTELPMAFLLTLALVQAEKGKMWSAVAALGAAVLVKPLALAAIPAVVVLLVKRIGWTWRCLVPLTSVAAVIPALIVPQPQALMMTRLEIWREALRRSLFWLEQAPELNVIPLVLILGWVVLHRRPDSPEYRWWISSTALFMGLCLFFVLNPLVTPGHFFIPRYALMLFAPTVIVLAGSLAARAQEGFQVVIVASLLVLSLVGTRGPFALGGDSPLHPVTERSLAFLDRLDEQRTGLAKLAGLTLEGFLGVHDAYAKYGYTYPEMGHFTGPRGETIVVLSPEGWEEAFTPPDRFVMLQTAPMLGGQGLLVIDWTLRNDPSYRISREIFGAATSFPAQVVMVESVP